MTRTRKPLNLAKCGFRPGSFLVTALLALTLGCDKGESAKAGDEARPAVDRLTRIEGFSRYAFAEPITHGNLTVVPIVNVTIDSQGEADRREQFVSLEEAKKNAWIEVHEIPGNEQVSSLEVKNVGPKPILLLAGELLLGGKQDRVVAKDTVVAPGKMVQVPVYCVDHDRWEGGDKFEATGSMVPQSVRDKAGFEDQSAVWREVESFNQKTSDYPALKARFGKSVRGGLQSPEVQRRIESDLPKFRSALDERKNVVGVVYVLNGEARNIELFGAPGLFRAARDGLLTGFLADAAVSRSTQTPAFSMRACMEFFRDVMSGERMQTALRSGTADWQLARTDFAGRESTLPEAKESNPVSGGANVFLHGSYSKNK